MPKQNSYIHPLDRALRSAVESLPPPKLLFKFPEQIKVTLVLSRSSVEYFKRAGRNLGVPYQRLICKTIDAYVERFPKE